MVGCKVYTLVGLCLCVLYPSWVQAQQTGVSAVQQEGLLRRVQQEGLSRRVQQVSISRRAQQELEEKEPLQQSVLQFDSVDARFPQLAQEDAPYPVRYTFTNRGSEAVRIERVTVSCGCLSVDIPERLIPAGGKGSITVAFHPKGYTGQVYRQAWVYTSLSAEQPTQRLSLTGQVLPPADRWYRYPHRLGLLRTRQQEITFRPTAGQRKLVESLVCVNSGDTPLLLSADGLPPYLTFATSQPILSPSEEADLLFTLHLDQLPPEVRRQGTRIEVTLQGATAPGTTAPGTSSEPRLNVIIIPFE